MHFPSDYGYTDSATNASGIRETSERTMIEAHKAGVAFWRNNRPVNASPDSLASVARSCGWHDADAVAWLAGFYGAQHRSNQR
jgi:hypothetical protein